jgi:hypothetical protein
MKCDYCMKEVTPDCDWRQGRCPYRPPLISEHSFRFYNLIQFIKGLFKRGNST